MATAALGMRFTRAALEGFVRAGPAIREGLGRLDPALCLDEATDDALLAIEDLLSGLCEGVGCYGHAKITDADRALVSKVLHRKRPKLIPLYDRAISERYSRGLGDKRLGRGAQLVRAIREDLQDPVNLRALPEIQGRLAVDLNGAPVPSRLRLLDIAIWMADRFGASEARNQKKNA